LKCSKWLLSTSTHSLILSVRLSRSDLSYHEWTKLLRVRHFCFLKSNVKWLLPLPVFYHPLSPKNSVGLKFKAMQKNTSALIRARAHTHTHTRTHAHTLSLSLSLARYSYLVLIKVYLIHTRSDGLHCRWLVILLNAINLIDVQKQIQILKETLIYVLETRSWK
jgi:hypothetical protein